MHSGRFTRILLIDHLRVRRETTLMRPPYAVDLPVDAYVAAIYETAFTVMNWSRLLFNRLKTRSDSFAGNVR